MKYKVGDVLIRTDGYPWFPEWKGLKVRVKKVQPNFIFLEYLEFPNGSIKSEVIVYPYTLPLTGFTLVDEYKTSSHLPVWW
jgi:hypothetical protein